MESGIFVGFWLKSGEYIVIASGEAMTPRTIRRRLVSERWANLEEIISVPVWPRDRPGHWQEAAVRLTGERRRRDQELDEAPLSWPPPGPGQSKSVYLTQPDFEAHGLTQGCRAMREGIRAQGHLAVCRVRMEEVAERRTRDTAGERTAERMMIHFADSPVDPAASSIASTSNAIAGGAAASASNVVAGGAAASASNVVAGGAAQDVAQDTVMLGGC